MYPYNAPVPVRDRLTNRWLSHCYSKLRSGFHELHQIDVPNPAALLQQIVRCQHVLGVIIADLLQRSVFPILGFLALRDCIRDLEIGVICVPVAENEIAFQCTDSSDADAVSAAFCVEIADILQDRPVIDPVVCVVAKVKAQIRQIVFLFPFQRTFGLHVEAVTGIENLRTHKNRDILAHRCPCYVQTVLYQCLLQTIDTGRCPKVVDDEMADRLKRLFILDLGASADILFKDLIDDALRIAALVRQFIQEDRAREASSIIKRFSSMERLASTGLP